MNNYKRLLLLLVLMGACVSVPAHGIAWNQIWSTYKKPLIGVGMVAAFLGAALYKYYWGSEKKTKQQPNQSSLVTVLRYIYKQVVKSENVHTDTRPAHLTMEDTIENTTVDFIKKDTSGVYELIDADTREYFFNGEKLWKQLKASENIIDRVILDKTHGHIFTHKYESEIVQPVVLLQANGGGSIQEGNLSGNMCGFLLLATAKAIDELVAEKSVITSFAIRKRAEEIWKKTVSAKYAEYNGQSVYVSQLQDIARELQWNSNLQEGFEFLQLPDNLDNCGVNFNDIENNEPRHYFLNIDGGHLTMATVLKQNNNFVIYYIDQLNIPII